MAVALDEFVKGAVKGGDDVELGVVVQVDVRIKTVVYDGLDAVSHVALPPLRDARTVLLEEPSDRRLKFSGAAGL